MSRFAEQLNAQVANEFAAHLQYVAVAAHYEALTLPAMAGLFYRQAREERDHAMMMLAYLLDTDSPVELRGIESPRSRFDGVVEPVALALEQERKVTEQIYALTRIAREESDFAAEQFMQWFIKEQVEEVSTMSALLTVATRNADSVEQLEDYVTKQLAAVEVDPTAPRIADA
ncbi:MAG TPA: ferritin [Dermatophilaceae bacterium]|nr:ferritin [Dermatophilaceae bacterium]